MIDAEIRNVVSRVLEVVEAAVRIDRGHVTVSCSMSVDYDRLCELAKALGTTDINFVYHEGEPGYSSWTPGTDGSFELTIGGIP